MQLLVADVALELLGENLHLVFDLINSHLKLIIVNLAFLESFDGSPDFLELLLLLAVVGLRLLLIGI